MKNKERKTVLSQKEFTSDHILITPPPFEIKIKKGKPMTRADVIHVVKSLVEGYTTNMACACEDEIIEFQMNEGVQNIKIKITRKKADLDKIVDIFI